MFGFRLSPSITLTQPHGYLAPHESGFSFKNCLLSNIKKCLFKEHRKKKMGTVCGNLFFKKEKPRWGVGEITGVSVRMVSNNYPTHCRRPLIKVERAELARAESSSLSAGCWGFFTAQAVPHSLLLDSSRLHSVGPPRSFTPRPCARRAVSRSSLHLSILQSSSSCHAFHPPPVKAQEARYRGN